MIAYEKLPLDNEVKAALEGLEIEYVFQPIFYKDCVRISVLLCVTLSCRHVFSTKHIQS